MHDLQRREVGVNGGGSVWLTPEKSWKSSRWLDVGPERIDQSFPVAVGDDGDAVDVEGGSGLRFRLVVVEEDPCGAPGQLLKRQRERRPRQCDDRHGYHASSRARF